MKKLFSFLLALGCTAMLWAQTSGTCGANLTWNYNSTTKTLTISGTGAMYNYNRISNGVTMVTTAPWSSYFTTMRSVVIGTGVTTIGDYAFSDCSGLTENLTIPNSVTTIGNYAFYGCSGLTGNLTIPDSVTTIGERAFYGCRGLTGNLTIPNSVTTIGSGAFSYCSRLTGLTIPNSITTIGNSAFYNCSGLTGNLTIPDSVTTIGERAFYGCRGLTGNLTIPNSVDTIGNSAFEGCSSLRSIISTATTPPTLGSKALPTSIVVFIPEGTTAAYTAAWGNDYTYYEVVELTLHIATPGGLLSAILEASATPNQVTKLTLTGTLNEDDWNCMKNTMPRLYSVNIAGIANTTLPNEAFKNKVTLLSVTLPDKLTEIGSSAFYGCSFLASITIPDSVKTIGSSAFYGCSSLTGNLTIPNSVTNIGNQAFQDCSGLTSVSIGKKVETIDYSAFEGCSAIDTITCYGSVPPVVSQAFSTLVPQNITLCVPKTALLSYYQSPVWGAFNIIGIDVPTDTYLLSLSAGTGGHIGYKGANYTSGTIEVQAEESIKVAIIPAAGYTVNTITLKGIDVKAQMEGDSLTIPALTENMTLAVSFTQLQYHIKFYTEGSGAFFQKEVLYGENFSLKILAQAGKTIQSVTQNGVDITETLGENGLLNINNITENITIIVSTQGGVITDMPSIPQVSSLRAWQSEETIFVECTEQMQSVEIYDINGRLVHHAKGGTYHVMTFPTQNKINIVKVTLKDGSVESVKVE